MSLVWRANMEWSQALEPRDLEVVRTWFLRRVDLATLPGEQSVYEIDPRGRELEMAHRSTDTEAYYFGLTQPIGEDCEVHTSFSYVTDLCKSLATVDILHFGDGIERPRTPDFLRSLATSERIGVEAGALHRVEEPDIPRIKTELVRALIDPLRAVPIVVYAASENARRQVFVKELLDRIGGIAKLVVAEPTEIQEALSPAGLEVAAETINISFPAAHTTESVFALQFSIDVTSRSPMALAEQVALPVSTYSTAQASPRELRQAIRAARQARDRSDEQLLEEVITLEELLETEREQRLATRAELEQEKLQTIAAENEVQSLRIRLAASSESSAAVDFAAIQPQSCVETVRLADQHLESICVPRTVERDCAKLDMYGNMTWPARAWRALSALNAYAKAKRIGFSGNFIDFCGEGSSLSIPVSWIALHESETTSNAKNLRRLRILPVSSGVTEEGRIYMPSHIKIVAGGSPAPRIHYYDDTSGSTKQVHIGYFGDHLSTSST